MKQEITVDEILQKLKPFGLFNIITYGLIMFPVFLTGFYASIYNFEAMDVDYRCSVPECEHLQDNEWLNFSIPNVGGTFYKCSRYAPREGEVTSDDCKKEYFDINSTIGCEDFFYYGNHSIVKEFDLGCQDWKRTLVGTLHNIGFFTSIPLTGILSDKFGRRFAIVFAAAMNAVFGILRAFSKNYVTFMVFEFLEPALGGGMYTACFVLAMELVGPKGRVFASLLLNVMFISGGVTCTLFAWWFQDWRKLLFTIYTPCLLTVSYLWILNESFRWLFSKGRCEEAVTVLKKAAKLNDIEIPEDYYDALVTQADDLRRKRKDQSKEANRSSFNQIIRSSMIWKRVAISAYVWVSSTLIYYGVSINAITLSGNPYINYIVVLVIELPANVMKLILLDRFGRKKVISIAYVLSGLICICYIFIPGGIWPLVFFLGGKFFITLAYNSLYVFVAEVYPTNFRTTLLAVTSTVGRIGSVLAPQTPLLALVFDALPMVLFGVVAVTSSLLVLLLPETNHQKLPDNLQEAGDLDKKQQADSKL